jgi:diguanylate cyclase (GGDEF)-like protein
MSILSATASYFHVLEPGGVLAVGGAVSLSTAFMMAIQAYKSRADRLALAVASFGFLLAALSFIFSAPHYSQVLPAPHILMSVMLGTASMFSAMCCLILLFQPKFSPPVVIACGVVCIAGYIKWPTGDALSHWFFVCQVLIALVTASMLASSKDTLAPQMRWFAIALCVIAVIGAGPRLWWIANSMIDPRLIKPQRESTEFRFAALVWVLLPIMLYAIVVGITQARTNKRLKNSSDFDMLTGAYSRRYLMDSGEIILKDCRLSANGFAVLLIDVDHFKQVNDTWGHAVGDEVLKHCVRNIQQVMRQTDSIVSRYGGEEFCILLAQQSEKGVKRLAERIRRSIADAPYMHGSVSIPITVSIGVSSDAAGARLSDLIAAADKKLYQAKHDGRNRVMHSLDGLIPV